jgi:hypothetical protein
MSFWERQMPIGMLLRSPWPACSLSDPGREYTLDRYRASSVDAFGEPVPIQRFVDYGRWFQRAVMPEVEVRRVLRVEQASRGFSLELEAGERLTAERVVVAAGIERFAWRPPEFRALPPELASHTVDHRDLSRFSGLRVVIAGGGQSALESAALLHEAGAVVEVIVRQPVVHWLTRRWQHRLPVVSELLYAWPDVGPAGVSHLVARPALFRRLPREVQDRLAQRAIRAAGAAWLAQRLVEVPISTGLGITEVSRVGGHMRLGLTDGSSRVADHVLLATGYRVDVGEYEFLSQNLVRNLDGVDGYPRLTQGFETTVAGLHFIGAPSAWSMGPLMRFVAGAEFAARRVARTIVASKGL